MNSNSDGADGPEAAEVSSAQRPGQTTAVSQKRRPYKTGPAQFWSSQSLRGQRCRRGTCWKDYFHLSNSGEERLRQTWINSFTFSVTAQLPGPPVFPAFCPLLRFPAASRCWQLSFFKTVVSSCIGKAALCQEKHAVPSVFCSIAPAPGEFRPCQSTAALLSYYYCFFFPNRSIWTDSWKITIKECTLGEGQSSLAEETVATMKDEIHTTTF